MRTVTVYRLDYDSNNGYPTRCPIGAVVELRKYERVNNYFDLLRMARRLFAVDTTDVSRIVIDMDKTRQEYLQEMTGNCAAG